MYSHTFKKSSWHYKLADNFWGITERNLDICSYRKAVFMGLLAFSTLLGLLITLASFIIDGFIGLYFSLYYHTFMISDYGFSGLMIFGSAIVLFSTIFICGTISDILYYRKWYPEKTVQKPDGFIKSSYKSIKDKYCVPVKFIDDVSTY